MIPSGTPSSDRLNGPDDDDPRSDEEMDLDGLRDYEDPMPAFFS
jgi:hypothetical protein